MRKLLMECIGTLFLMMAVAFSGNNPIAVGLMLAVMVYSGGHLSGGHFNPAVSLAAWMRGKLGVADMVQYMVAQVVGACLGWLVHSYLMGGSTAPMPTEHPVMHGVVAEALLAFALVTVVLNMMSSRSAGNPVGGLAIGFTLSAALYTGAGVSGGAFQSRSWTRSSGHGSDHGRRLRRQHPGALRRGSAGRRRGGGARLQVPQRLRLTPAHAGALAGPGTRLHTGCGRRLAGF